MKTLFEQNMDMEQPDLFINQGRRYVVLAGQWYFLGESSAGKYYQSRYRVRIEDGNPECIYQLTFSIIPLADPKENKWSSDKYTLILYEIQEDRDRIKELWSGVTYIRQYNLTWSIIEPIQEILEEAEQKIHIPDDIIEDIVKRR